MNFGLVRSTGGTDDVVAPAAVVDVVRAGIVMPWSFMQLRYAVNAAPPAPPRPPKPPNPPFGNFDAHAFCAAANCGDAFAPPPNPPPPNPPPPNPPPPPPVPVPPVVGGRDPDPGVRVGSFTPCWLKHV